jgi:hypothetical protein
VARAISPASFIDLTASTAPRAFEARVPRVIEQGPIVEGCRPIVACLLDRPERDHGIEPRHCGAAAKSGTIPN